METKIIRFVYSEGGSITGYRCSEPGDMSGEYVRREDHEAALERAGATAVAIPAELHPNTADLVRRFAAALAQKLRKAEVKYGYADGWTDKNWANVCRLALVEHVNKGDPRDVAIYAAFLWHHGWHASLAPFFAELNAQLIKALACEVPPAPLLAKLPELLLKMRKALAEIATKSLHDFEDAEEFRTWARSVAAHALPGSPSTPCCEGTPIAAAEEGAAGAGEGVSRG